MIQNFHCVTSIAVLNPANIRSIHAAFDPSQSSSANLLYQGAELDMSHEARMARADEQGLYNRGLSRLVERH